MICQSYLNQFGMVSRPPAFLRQDWDHFVAVPLAGEPDGGQVALETLCSAAQGHGRTLIVLVLNQRPSATQATIQGNALTRQWVGGRAHGVGWQLSTRGDATLALWDWAGARCFEEGEGVGKARRLGADLAASLFAEGYLRTPYFFTTDGDAQVPPNYLVASPGRRLGGQEGGETVGVFRFSHRSDRAHRLYDLYLRYHPEGLAFAGSPYAFPPIGSTLKIPIRAYCQARGFPLRLAGEDFHLLNKLAKMCPIHQMDARPIGLSGRPSDRVPFGTGPATARLQDRHLYLDHPDIYRALRDLMDWGRRSVLTPHSLSEVLSPRWGAHTAGIVSFSALAERAMAVAWETRRTPEDRWRHWWTHFDGLRTYQWVRRMRQEFPPIPFERALELAPFNVEMLDTADKEGGELLEGGLPHWRGDGPREAPAP